MDNQNQRDSLTNKRQQLEQQAPATHVRPAPGRTARQIRQAAASQRQSKRRFWEWPRQGNADSPEAAKPITPMQPRSWRPRRLPRNSPERVEEHRPLERVRPIGLVWLSWRWVSGTLTGVLLVILVGMLSSDAFYVTTVSVGGVNYLSREDVFRFAGISNEHIFWVNSQEIEARLEANNNIAEAEVRVGWPPRMVQILVQERAPVMIWEQANDRVWVDVNGLVMFQREDRPDLLRVVYDPSLPEAEVPVTPDTRLPQEVVHGALLLKSQLASIDVLLYHPQKGLGWRDPRGWMAWFGIGDNMAMKARVYESLVAYNIDALQFAEINIADPDNPVYTVLWRKSD
jgi:hypothetical protein